MSPVVYKFRVPDESRPIGGEPPPWGPFFELVDFKPGALSLEQVVGRPVDEMCTHVGTYGMGGPGFFGLRLADKWLVISIWGASSWIQINGRIVQDIFWNKTGMPRPWISDEGDELSNRLVGQTISAIDVRRYSLMITIGDLCLAVTEQPDGRPIFAGNGKPRKLSKGDDLRRAVFIAPTAEIWV